VSNRSGTFKKSGSVLRERIHIRLEAIARFSDDYPVGLMCRCVNVSRSGYYAWKEREPSPRTIENDALLEEIRSLHEQSDGVWGSGRIWDELIQDGMACGQNRVARLMRVDGLRGIPQRRRWGQKPSGDRPDGVTNHLSHEFHSDEPNRKWVIDITYIRTQEGWLYLACVLDLFKKNVVGWSMSAVQDTHLVLQAVLMAIKQRRDGVHSALGQGDSVHQPRIPGVPAGPQPHIEHECRRKQRADNAAAEGFFGMLKRERVNRRNYRTRDEARSDIFDYIERIYNPTRSQDGSTLNGVKYS